MRITLYKQCVLSFKIDHLKNVDYKKFRIFSMLFKVYKMTLCYYYITYAFQISSTFYNCLNDKELLARNKRGIIIVVYLVLTKSPLFIIINLFYVTGLFLTTLKTSLFFVFRRHRKRPVA